MKRIRFVYVALAALVTVLAVPAAGVSKGSAIPTSVGAGEGKLTLVAWEGYTEKQWVAPFEKATGCKVSAKYAGSSNDMFNLMTSGGGGQYDMVSASGDASLRLIYSGAVAEVNVGLIPSYKDFFKAFQSPSTNTVDGKHYGVSLQFGPNLLLYNTAKEKKPDELGRDLRPQEQGQDHDPRQPDPDRRRGALPLEDEAWARDHRPLRADEGPARRGRRPAQAAASARQEVLGARVRPDRPLQERGLDARGLVAVSVLAAPRGEGQGRDRDPEGGRHGLARHLDAVVQVQASELRLQVDAVHLDAQGRRPSRRSYYGETPVNKKACADHEHARQGLVRAATRPTPRRATTGRSSSGRRRSPIAVTARRTAPT